LNGARDEFEAAGGKLVLIGQATPRQAAHFRRHRSIDVPVLADEQRQTYKIAGAKMGSVIDLVGPRSVAKGALTTMRTGMFQGRTIGNPAQLGGAMVVDRDEQIVWSRMARDAADNASPEEILAAVRRAR
jgi:peroxiredoxin